MSTDFRVHHEPAERRFVVRLPAGSGELLYHEAGRAMLDLHHVEVAPALRGRGIAGALVAAACRHARAGGLKLIPSCPYVEWWFQHHPDCQELLHVPE